MGHTKETDCSNKGIIENQNILTDKGYSKINNLKVGDLVYTHANNYKKILNIKKFNYKGNIISVTINGYNKPLNALPEQSIHMYRGQREYRTSHKVSWCRIDKLNVGDMLAYPCSCPTVKSISFDYAEILGNFLLHGYIDNNNRVIFKSNNDNTIKNSLISCITSLNLPFETFEFENSTYITLLTCPFELFDICYSMGGKYNREIPETIIRESINFLRNFIKPFILDNRDKYKSMYFRASSSENLFLGLQRILLRLNSFSNVYKCTSKDKSFEYFVISLTKKELSRIGNSSSDIWFKNFKYAFFRVDSIIEMPYEGIAYNILVENDSSFCSHIFTLLS